MNKDLRRLLNSTANRAICVPQSLVASHTLRVLAEAPGAKNDSEGSANLSSSRMCADSRHPPVCPQRHLPHPREQFLRHDRGTDNGRWRGRTMLRRQEGRTPTTLMLAVHSTGTLTAQLSRPPDRQEYRRSCARCRSSAPSPIRCGRRSRRWGGSCRRARLGSEGPA